MSWLLSDRSYSASGEHARGAPEPDVSIVSRLQAQNPLIPKRIVDEPDVFDLKIGLSVFPFFRPGQMGLVELLPQFRNFDCIRIREKNSEQHGSPASFSPSQYSERRGPGQPAARHRSGDHPTVKAESEHSAGVEIPKEQLSVARGPACYAEPLILNKKRFLRKRFWSKASAGL